MVSVSTDGTPLQVPFTFWFMRRGKSKETNTPQSSTTTETSNTATTSTTNEPTSTAASNTNPSNPYENSIKQIATVSTVEEFWTCYDHLIRPNDLSATTDYHFFRQGIKPTWEDSSNAKGGKWIVRLRKGLASRYWEEVVLALIGSQFSGVPDGEVCGCVVSIRYSEDIVSVWNRTANDREITERLRENLKRILQLPSFVHMEYKPHETALQDKSSFRNTQVWKSKSALEREAQGGAGGSGGGGGGSGTSAGNSSSGNIGGSKLRSSSWSERDELRGTKTKRDTEKSWR